MIGWALDTAVGWILDSVRDTLNLVWKLLTSTVFHLPDVTGLPQVETLAGRSLLVVNTAYVLVISAAGLVVMTHGSAQIRYGAGELLPRLVIGLVAANFATPICVATIAAANALVQALTGQGIASTDAFAQLLRMITQQLHDPVAALLSAVIGLILVVLVVMLITGWITRWILLIVLCGIAPVALACHGTPWSEGAARVWWRCMGGICLSVVLQAVALNTSLSILLDPDANLTTFGLPDDASGLLNLVIVAVLLWITVRIPSLIRSYLSQGGNRHNLFGALVRLVIAQQVTRGLGQAIRGATASVNTSRGSHTGVGRHISGGARGRRGTSKHGAGKITLGAPEYSRGSHGGLGRHVSGGARGRGGNPQRDSDPSGAGTRQQPAGYPSRPGMRAITPGARLAPQGADRRGPHGGPAGPGAGGGPAGTGPRGGPAGPRPRPGPAGTGAHSGIGRHAAGAKRNRGGFDNWTPR